LILVKVIIPAYNEENAIAKVIQAIPNLVAEVIVVNNNSTDNTAQVAQQAGATVLHENQKGYGYACLKGMQYVAEQNLLPNIIVFIDGDFSDYPEKLTDLIEPIINKQVQFVVGARAKHLRGPNSLTVQQAFGNWLACFLMKLFFKSKFTDLGPFRAIDYNTLLNLHMSDKTYGWTVEMQLKVLKQKISYTEVPVPYKERIGVSKVSGTLKGTLMAGYKIIGWILKYSIKK
jgi:glycosyltransferase involved in cell wall biosynthesis